MPVAQVGLPVANVLVCDCVGLFGFLDVPSNHLLLDFFEYVSLAAPLAANGLVCDLVTLLGDWLDLLALELTVLLNYLLALVVLVFVLEQTFVKSPVEVRNEE